MRPPVIVVGSGRSGTSNCTMLLHTRLGIDMGHAQWIGNSWRPDKWRTTKGNWERASTRLVLHAAMKLKDLCPYLIVETIAEIGYIYGDRPWGFKHPNFTYYLPILIEHFPDAWYIHCSRKAKHAAKSMKTIYTADKHTTEQDYFRRVLERQKICREQLAKAENSIEVNIDDYKKYGEDGVLAILSDFTGMDVLPEPTQVPEPYHKHGPVGGLLHKMAEDRAARTGETVLVDGKPHVKDKEAA